MRVRSLERLPHNFCESPLLGKLLWRRAILRAAGLRSLKEVVEKTEKPRPYGPGLGITSAFVTRVAAGPLQY